MDGEADGEKQIHDRKKYIISIPLMQCMTTIFVLINRFRQDNKVPVSNIEAKVYSNRTLLSYSIILSQLLLITFLRLSPEGKAVASNANNIFSYFKRQRNTVHFRPTATRNLNTAINLNLRHVLYGIQYFFILRLTPFWHCFISHFYTSFKMVIYIHIRLIPFTLI